MISSIHFTEKQRELFSAMVEISESCYAAHWISGNEYAIWDALQTGCTLYGRGTMDLDLLRRCSDLSRELNGWIAWLDDSHDPELSVEDWGAYFVPMDDWLKLVSVQCL